MNNLFSTDFLVFVGRKGANMFSTGSLVLEKNGYSKNLLPSVLISFPLHILFWTLLTDLNIFVLSGTSVTFMCLSVFYLEMFQRFPLCYMGYKILRSRKTQI